MVQRRRDLAVAQPAALIQEYREGHGVRTELRRRGAERALLVADDASEVCSGWRPWTPLFRLP